MTRAPQRAAELGSRVLQLFTKQPSRWAEPVLAAETIAAFAAERTRHRIHVMAAHDAYLINLATADAVLFARSLAAFRAELERCAALGIELLVTHPGNATDGDTSSGLARNAAAVEQALDEVPGRVRVLFETTAGSGTALGASFDQLAQLIGRVAQPHRDRVGACIDTCHVWAAGYDLRGDYDGVLRAFDDAVGIARLGFIHLNDAAVALGSRTDRHAHIGEGALGAEPFRRLLCDPRLTHVPKVLETPKDGDALTSDRRNLRRLRRWRSAQHRVRTKG